MYNNKRLFEDLHNGKSIVRICKSSEKERQMNDIFKVFLDVLKIDVLYMNVCFYYTIVLLLFLMIENERKLTR